MSKITGDPKELITARLPEQLFVDVKLLLADPVTGRVRYGAMSKLVERLLREWVDQQRQISVTKTTMETSNV
jgi:hypothetical protein